MTSNLNQILLTGEEAEKLEALLGVTVLRHKYKKPQGGADELETHFGYEVPA